MFNLSEYKKTKDKTIAKLAIETSATPKLTAIAKRQTLIKATRLDLLDLNGPENI
jgi:hypothetical protein